jgi:surface antigen/LysM repeat protein
MLRSVTASSALLLRLTPFRVFGVKWRSLFGHKRLRTRLVYATLLLVNALLLGLVGAVVALNPTRANGNMKSVAATTTDTSAATQPVDTLASVNIAVTLAHLANLPEADAVANQSDSAAIDLAVASTDNTIVNKPQAVTSSFLSNKDIHTYITQPGDTVSSLATKFSVSTNSLLWSNTLTGDNLAAGKQLVIPPVNGIVYTVKSADTTNSLASTYRSDEAKIIAYNDAEISGLKVGEQIIIPDGQIITPKATYAYYATGFAWGTSAIYGENGYDWGNCTWYVATQINVPANWGNAATWAAGARAAGWHVSSVPTAGAIAQNSYMAGGLGHVAIVNDVSPDGSQVLIRDMNGIAGFDRVGVAWQPTSLYSNYITR